MRRTNSGAWALQCLALLAGLGAAPWAMAQAGTPRYASMAPVEQYLTADREAEIALARSAAPAAISREATVLVLGRHGYETAVVGSNGFVCLVGRAWTAAFDWAEFWNPKVRAADCMNPQSARSVLPAVQLRARMVMAGRSREQMIAALRQAYADKRLPQLEEGAMDYMMSAASYLTDEGEHNLPHVMFYTRIKDARDWGAGAAGSPVMASPYWFFSPDAGSRAEGLPPMLVFLVAVPSADQAGMTH